MGALKRAKQGWDLLEHLRKRLVPLGQVRRYWVAYSGGLDSSVLLSALAELRQQDPKLPGLDQLAAIHVDHGLQGQSAAWVEHCAARCAELAVPLAIAWPDKAPASGESLEAWGHAVRRSIFSRLLGVGEVLLLAQHRDDQAETVLLALLRGSGLKGLAAMPEMAPLGAGQVYRPFLDLERAALIEYAGYKGLCWLDDPSNAQTHFDRNYLRQQVMPLLRARWPAVSANLARSARLCAEGSLLIERLAAQTLETMHGPLPGTLSRARLGGLDRPLAKAVLRLWIQRQGFRLPDARRLERLLDELLPARPDANPLLAWSGCEVRCYRDALIVLSPLPPAPVGATLDWSLGGWPDALTLPAGLGRLTWEPGPGGPDRPFAVQVRFGTSGLSCRTRPQGPRRPLKRLFQEFGIPAWLRPRWPLVLVGGRLIAVPGLIACWLGQESGLAGSISWPDCPWQGLWPRLTHPLGIHLG